MSLYAALFKYAAKKGYSPLENFLTNALADLLNRWCQTNETFALAFVSEALCLERSSSFPERRLQNQLLRAKLLVWTSQRPIILSGQSGFLDLCLYSDGQLVLAIESKVKARMGGRPQRIGTGRTLSNLKFAQLPLSMHGGSRGLRQAQDWYF